MGRIVRPSLRSTLTVSVSLVALAACNPTIRGDGYQTTLATVERIQQINEADRGMNAQDLALFEQQAQQGDNVAQLHVGRAYLYGDGVEKNIDLGVRYLTQAANNGFGPALDELAQVYGYGYGVKEDGVLAKSYAERASRTDYLPAKATIAMVYLLGWGTQPDVNKALDYLHQGADKKVIPAIRVLAETYRDGKGIAPDRVMADAWFLVAKRYVEADEKAEVEQDHQKLALLLLPEEKALAQLMADEWQPGRNMINIRNQKAAQLKAQPQLTQQTNLASEYRAPNFGSLAPRDLPFVRLAKISELPLTVKVLTQDIVVAPDGSSVSKTHSQYKLNNEAAAKEYGQVPIYFDSELETVEVVEAYTLKADGRKIVVPPEAMYVTTDPDTPTEAWFNSRKQKTVVFPNLAAGDTIVLTSKISDRPMIPGVFTYTRIFDETRHAESLRTSITAPKSMVMQIETHGPSFSRKEIGNNVVYEWKHSNTKPLLEPNIALDAQDRWPRFHVSSLKSWQEFGEKYQPLVAPHRGVTPEIKKQADKITAGITDRRKQAEAIYNWVSRNIRYVAVHLGSGAIVPHPAKNVLKNGYGDCKDHSVLLSSLLAAKGISSEYVLISAGYKFGLSKAPVISAFNHAITYIPEFDQYLDSTAEVAPFGQLPFAEYGKPVLHVGERGVALKRTPLLQPNQASYSQVVSATLSADGKLVGQSETVGEGPYAIHLRQIGTSIQSQGEEASAIRMMKESDINGTGRYIVDPPYVQNNRYKIGTKFEYEVPKGEMEGDSFYLPTGPGLLSSPGDYLAGPIDFRDDGREPTACFSGKARQELNLTLPEGRKLRKIPENVSIKKNNASYSAQWNINGNRIQLVREFSSQFSDPICMGSVRYDMAAILGEIREHLDQKLAME